MGIIEQLPSALENTVSDSAPTASPKTVPPSSKPPMLVPAKYVGVFGLLVLVGVIWLLISLQSRERQIARTEHALVLQTLAAHTGAAAVLAERGSFAEARRLMTLVFDDIQRRGLEEGGSSLPANQAAVLDTRDTVMLSLDRGQNRISALLNEEFFRLQAPATSLEASALIDALMSGTGRTLVTPVNTEAPPVP